MSFLDLPLVDLVSLLDLALTDALLDLSGPLGLRALLGHVALLGFLAGCQTWMFRM